MAAARRVLLVEDEVRLAEALADGLREEGLGVDLALDGGTGLGSARANRYDVILLDLMLPRLDGFTFCQRLRAAEDWTPLLVLTARGRIADETRALAAGADDYLRKPFAFSVLLARINALLRRRAAGRSRHVVAGDLTLDTAGHRCWRGQAEVTLTPREFMLLECLIRRAGEVVSRRELLDEVWDFAMPDDTNVVDVYIGYLRRKLDAPSGPIGLHTVRGIGYRLDAVGG